MPAPRSTCRARVLARDVAVARDPPGPSSVLNVLAGRVEDLRDDGPSRVTVRIAIGAGPAFLLARITRRSKSALCLERGAEVHALVKSVAIVT